MERNRKHVVDPDQILTELLDDPSFVRWINGEASQKERIEWERWENKSPLHEDLKQKAVLFFSLPLEESEASDVEEQLAGLHKRMDENENRRRKIFRLPSQAGRKGGGYRLAVAAAVVLLIAGVGVLAYYFDHQQEQSNQPLYSTVEVGYGEKGLLKISDGSSIRLNANSSLRYSPDQFNSSKVEVWLDGEAYFSIIRNPGNKKRTFIVHTPDGEIRVLGTRFNINTRFQRTGVVLEQGSIEVTAKDSLQRVTGRRLIQPGLRALLKSGESNIEVRQVDTLLYTAWLDGKLVFEETPLPEVIQNIEQTYGITMEVEDPELLDKSVSGSFRNPDLKTLIKGLEEVFNLNIQQKTETRYLISEQ